MKTTLQKVVVKNRPRNRSSEKRINRFFRNALKSIPKDAQLISAKGISRQGYRFVSYTYKLNDNVVTKIFKMEGRL